MKKSMYEILKQSFYEINEHYMKYISALALQAFLLIGALLFLPPFGIILAFLIMVITQIGLAKYSLRILNKKPEQIKQVAEINKFTFSHIITFIIKTFQIAFFSLFLIVPGLIKCLEYSQTDFILAENEKMETSEALLESKKLTHNSKGRVLMLFVTHAFLSIVLIAFSASVVILTSFFVGMSQTIMLVWFAIMSVFLLCVLALPFYTISRTILYENLKIINKFNKTPSKSFMEEVAQEFMTAFKPTPKQKKETKNMIEDVKKETKTMANKTKNAVKDTADKVEKGVKKTADKVEKGVKRTANKVKKGVKSTADKVEKGVTKTK